MSMRKIKEVLRLRFELRLGQREIARACSISQGAVHNYLKRAAAAGIAWPTPEGWDEQRVEYGTGPVMLYEVEGLADGQKISIRNVRPATLEPVWQIGAHIKGRETRWTGTFESADEALAQLQEQLDSADEEITGVAQ